MFAREINKTKFTKRTSAANRGRTTEKIKREARETTRTLDFPKDFTRSADLLAIALEYIQRRYAPEPSKQIHANEAPREGDRENA